MAEYPYRFYTFYTFYFLEKIFGQNALDLSETKLMIRKMYVCRTIFCQTAMAIHKIWYAKRFFPIFSLSGKDLFT